jgi:hypothetical protein
MKGIPRTIPGKLAAIVWLASCVSVLAFAYIKQSIHDMPEVAVWSMAILSFPSSILSLSIFGPLWAYTSAALGLNYHPFWDLIPFWLVNSLLGYFQWFVLLPWLFQKLISKKARA